jgi:hypothetical protein
MSETYTPQNLIAGDFPMIRDEITLVSGQNIVVGTVLGLITASGKVEINSNTASGGANIPYAVALAAADATLGDVTHVPIALTGEFNKAKLVFGANTVFADMKAALRSLSIFGKDTVL